MRAGDAATGRVPLSACIVCFQEEDRIGDCVRSVDFCDEILVVDSGSSDRTREIAAELGARVLVRAPWPGMARQRQVSVDEARHDWVLCLDADERVTPGLRERILELREAGFGAPGYLLPRRNHYLGRVVRRGSFWPDRKLRLFDRRAARCVGTDPHDRVELEPGLTPVLLDRPLEHLSYRDFAAHVRTVRRYADVAARAALAGGRRAHVWDLLVRPPAALFKGLVVKRGFVDGWRGFLIAAMACWYDGLKYWRMLRLQRRGAIG